MNPVAVLSQNGVDFQDNVLDVTAYQYWGDIDIKTGEVEIPMVKAGTVIESPQAASIGIGALRIAS